MLFSHLKFNLWVRFVAFNMQRSTWLHLRIHFSFFLLPVFLFALSISTVSNWYNAIMSFIILHFLLYPASNGYNSYFDKDEGSIGGLKNPPQVTTQLYFVSLIFDLVAILLGALIIGYPFAIMLLIYGVASKAYSHPSIRLKKYAIPGWLTIFIFQGYFTFLMAYLSINDASISQLWKSQIQLPAILSSVLLGGAYPMTQIYQHQEDRSRGDITFSIKLGILGTFHFTAVMFLLATAGFIYYYLNYFDLTHLLLFQLLLVPSLFYFLRWYFEVRKNLERADYKSTMRLNLISSSCLNLFFILKTFVNT